MGFWSRERWFGDKKETEPAGKKFQKVFQRTGADKILEVKSNDLPGHLHSGFDETSAWQEINWPIQHSGAKPPKTLRVVATISGIDIFVSHSSVVGEGLKNLKEIYYGYNSYDTLTFAQKVDFATQIAERNSPAPVSKPEPASNPQA